MKVKIMELLRSIRIDTLLLAIIATTSCLSYIETQYMKKQIRYIQSSLYDIENNTDNTASSVDWIEHYISIR